MSDGSSAGLQVMGGFIVGFDSDTPSIFRQQIDFIQKSGIVTAMVGMLQAPPGTRLFERLQRNRVVGPFPEIMSMEPPTSFEMGLNTLIEGYQAVWHISILPGTITNVKTLLSELTPKRVTGFSAGPCILPIQLTAGHYWQGAFRVLASAAMDLGPQAQTAVAGHQPDYLWPSLPENLRIIHSLSRVAGCVRPDVNRHRMLSLKKKNRPKRELDRTGHHCDR
jgi:hypothetical protein